MPKTTPHPDPQRNSAPGSAASSLQQRKQQFVRDAIWDAAIQLFSDKGFDETTVDDIAEAAGTSRRSFFRYFDSKSDLMAQAIVSYGTSLTDAVRSCPKEYSLHQVFRHTMLQAATHSASQGRTRRIMEIAAKYPAAREAQIRRVAEVQEHLADAFAERSHTHGKGDLTAHVLAGLTLSLLSVTFRTWFANGQKDIAVTVEQVLAAAGQIVTAPSARR